MTHKDAICALAAVLAVSFVALAMAQEFRSLAGAPGAVVNYPAGELKVGSTTIWSKGGLTCSIKLYESNPNRSASNWQSVTITTVDGKTENAGSIETIISRNFVSVLREVDNKVLWIPFEAIEAVRTETTDPKCFQAVSVQEEVYGWFRLQNSPSDFENISAVAQVSLCFPDSKGDSVVRGRLLDGQGSLTLFFREKDFKEIAWSSVRRVDIHREKERETGTTRSSLAPRCVYRTLGQWSNVWNEYSIPAGD